MVKYLSLNTEVRPGLPDFIRHSRNRHLARYGNCSEVEEKDGKSLATSHSLDAAVPPGRPSRR